MAGQKFDKGRLTQAFKGSFQLDKASKRQFKAGLATTAVSYAALGVLCAADANASHLLIKSFSWQQIPLHALLIMGTNLIGAAGMAAYDHLKGHRKPDEQRDDPVPAVRSDTPQP